MYILISESRGVEFASSRKQRCELELKRLRKDDSENGGYEENYWIEKDDTGFYKEGFQ